MKLNISKESIETVHKQKSPIKKRETIKGTEVVPFIENSKFYCVVGNTKYEIIVDNEYKPIYRFSTKENDKYVTDTIRQGFKEIHYTELSDYWTYLSTTVPIKVLLQGDKAIAKTNMLNVIYTKHYKEYCNESYKRSKAQ